MLTVSQVFSTIAFSIKSLNGLNPLSGMVAFLLGTAFNFVVIIPFFIACKKYGWDSLLNLSYKKLGKVSYIVAILFLVLLLCVCTSTVVVFEDFLSSTVLKESSAFVIIILLIASSVYGAFLGIEALGRFANIVFVLLSVSVLVILFSILKDVELINFGGISISNTDKILKTAIEGVFANTGLLTAVLLTPIVNKKHSKSFTIWNAASLILVELIAFSVSGALGDYAVNKQYPYYNTATVAEFSIFKRLDIIYMCVWALAAFIKTTYYLILSKSVLDTFLHKSARKHSLFFCTVIISVFSLISSLRSELYNYMQNFISSGIVTLIVVILPLLLLIFGGKRRENS